MTIQQTIAAIRALGIRVRYTVRGFGECTDGEFRLTFADNNEDSAYYTTDRQDALDTARAMAGK